MIQKLIILFVMLLCTTTVNAQTPKKAGSKTATTVDSVNTPPRMDGNTGQYDTVRKMPEKKSAPTKEKVEYNYQMHTDSIGIRKTGNNR